MKKHVKINSNAGLWLICGILSLCGVVLLIIYLQNGAREKESTIICTRLPRVKIRGRRPALAPNYRLQWDNHKIINVYFLAGVNKFTKSIMITANEWSKYCGIKFVITPNEFDAQVKVSFKSGGYASAIGIECLQTEYDTQPSMFLQGIDTLKDKEAFRRIVLHEFGHILGIEHELRKPSANIPWNKEQVYKYYLDTYKWNSDRVDREIFSPLEPGKKEYEEFDSTSIMVYAIGPPLTEKEYSISWPKGLSKKDIEGISKWYPK